MNLQPKRYTYSIPWNLFLITVGSVLFAIGLKAIAVPHGFITGGLAGVSLLIYYVTDFWSPGLWYLVVNVPIFLFGWLFISKRFFFYSIYGMLVLTAAIEAVNFTIPVNNHFLAVLAGGSIIGAGAGVTLRSLGSLGGNDIIAILVNKKFNIRIGTYFFCFNLVLFAFSFGALEVDLVLYSLAMSFVVSYMLDYVLTMFNQRKLVLIISEKYEAISEIINTRLKRGATYLYGRSTYTKKTKRLINTFVQNFKLKRMDEAVYTIDPEAFMIMENTFNVLGKGFSSRKVY